MTKNSPLFFDTDCLSAFLWVGEEALLPQLFPGRIVIPEVVYEELSYPTIRHLKDRVDSLVAQGKVVLQDISTDPDSEEFPLYQRLTTVNASDRPAIGRGEAAAIAMAKVQNGILASNNLRDISIYVKEFNLRHETTGSIMKQALDAGMITEEQGNEIWARMRAKKRRLGANSFTDFLNQSR